MSAERWFVNWREVKKGSVNYSSGYALDSAWQLILRFVSIEYVAGSALR